MLPNLCKGAKNMSEIENLKELRIKCLNGNRRTKDQILTSRDCLSAVESRGADQYRQSYKQIIAMLEQKRLASRFIEL
jgi:hypothetical protein